jgi:DNA-binding beta-propeller fold protein YncE
MDIQSSVLNELFVLYPLIIQGWVSPVKPADIAHGGIPKALYDGNPQGLECLVDPWTELQMRSWTMSVDDRVDVYVNDDPTPVTGRTVAPGEETQRIRLYIPHGRLIQGVNRLHYKVTRPGGNVEPSRNLLVLYHLRTPDSLDLVIPPDVITNGVDAARAALGVEFGFTWSNRRAYDRIRFQLGDETIQWEVPDAPAPVVQKLFIDTFQKVGDNPSTSADFVVFDQLGNSAQSPTKRLDIHLAAVVPVPTLTNVQDANDKEIPNAGITTSTTLKLTGTAGKGKDVEIYDGSGPSAVPKGKATADATTGVWELTITVAAGAHRLYAKSLYHSSNVYSNVRTLTVIAVIVPTLTNVQDTSGKEIPNTGTTTSTTLKLIGKASKGKEVEIYDGSGPSAVPKGKATADAMTGVWERTITVAAGAHRLYAKSLYHSGDVFSNVRTLTVVVAVAPTIDSVKGSPSGVEIPPGGPTVETSVTLTGKASKGQKVQVLDGSTPKGEPTADLITGIWTLLVTELSVALHSFIAKALYGTGQVSTPRTLTVTTVGNPAFTNPPYVIDPAGQVKDIVIRLIDDKGQPVAGGNLTLTLPGGFTFADGDSGARNFTTVSNGTVTVSGVKGHSAPGIYDLIVVSGEQSVKATVTITGVLQHISVYTYLSGMVLNQDGSRAYACHNERYNKVTIIDTINQKVLNVIPTGNDSVAIAISRDGTRLVTIEYNAQAISFYDPVNQVLLRTIEAPEKRGIGDVALSPDGKRAFFPSFLGITQPGVLIVDVERQTVVKTVLLGAGQAPLSIALTPDGTRALIAPVNGGLAVFNTVSETVIKTLPVKSSWGRIAVSADGTRAVVCIDNAGVAVIDAVNWTVIGSVSIGGWSKNLAISPDSSRVYVTSAQKITIINIASLRVEKTIQVDGDTGAIAISPDGTRAYVSNTSRNTVMVMAIG